MLKAEGQGLVEVFDHPYLDPTIDEVKIDVEVANRDVVLS